MGNMHILNSVCHIWIVINGRNNRAKIRIIMGKLMCLSLVGGEPK